MKPVTPLRRSERLRRPTPKAIGSSPSSSPGTTAYDGRPINSRSRVFYPPGGQTDSDSTLRNTSSSKSSGSSTEDTVGDATDYMALAANFPPKLYQAYQGLAPLLRYSNAELMRRDISVLNGYLKELNPFLRGVIGIGQSCQWREFNNFTELCKRIAKVIETKRAALPPKMQEQDEFDFKGMGNGLDFRVGEKYVVMTGEHWQEASRDQADTGYIQSIYRNAAPPNNFGWDDAGASGSEVQETDALDYSLSYPTARTLDYCTIPDTY